MSRNGYIYLLIILKFLFMDLNKTYLKLRKELLALEPDNPADVHDYLNKLSNALNDGAITKDQLKLLNRSLGTEFLKNTVQGHALLKPYGYSGDFMLIDKIYTLHKSPVEPFRKWDEFSHKQAAPIAVRNRKEYFKKFIRENLNKRSELELLNIASGPARDLKELYEDLNGFRLKTMCVEMDAQAVNYAKQLTADFQDDIHYLNRNVFRCNFEQKFDLIWSAGLFDYFDDKAFVFLLKKLKGSIKENGEIVIGNFNKAHNPSREYMELFGEWYLNHRSREELIELGLAAGFDSSQLSVQSEELKVNLFLHIKN